MDFLNFLEKQRVIDFTGRINILEDKTSKHLGWVLMKDGIIVDSKYQEQLAETALYSILIDDLDEKTIIDFVSEPEIIAENIGIMHITVDELHDRFSRFVRTYLESRKLRPPDHIKLVIRPQFIESGFPVEKNEFEILKCLTDYSKVGDLYEQSNIPSFEVTNGLVSLRKKNALTVLK